MPALHRPLTLLTVALLGTASTGAVLAQSVIVSNGPAGNNTIPLAPSSTVQIDASGNLLVTCSTTPCAALVTGSGGGNVGAPTSSAARNDGDSDVRAGEFVRIAWTSADAEACVASSTPATTFVGVRPTSNATGETISLSAAGDYAFRFQCFNAAGGSTLQTINVTVGTGTVVQPSNCTLAPDALLQPAGFQDVPKTWSSTWSARDGDPQAAYPQSVGFPVPVGADKGTYRTTSFVAGSNEVVQISWEQVQANPQQGYSNPRPAEGMYFTISPCAGDFRVPNVNSSDPFLQAGCRRGGSVGGLIYHTTATPSNFQSCRLEAGKTYFMNVIAANPEDGLSVGEHSCATVANSANGCDVNATHRPAQ